MSQNVSVTLDADNRIQVQVGLESLSGDCYYLAIDREVSDSPVPVSESLRNLLQGWIRALLETPDGEQTWLPFDFSDEATRWLACQRCGDEVIVVPGWAAVEGWAIAPSDSRSWPSLSSEFTPDEPLNPQVFYRPAFLSQIRRSLARLPGSPVPSAT